MQPSHGKGPSRTGDPDELGQSLRNSPIADELSAKDHLCRHAIEEQLKAADSGGLVIRIVLKDGSAIDGKIRFAEERGGVFFLNRDGTARGSTHISNIAAIPNIAKPDSHQAQRNDHDLSTSSFIGPLLPEQTRAEILKFLIEADAELAQYHTEQRRLKHGCEDPRWLIEFRLWNGSILIGRAAIGKNPTSDLLQGKPFLVLDEIQEIPARVRLSDIKSVRKVY